MTHHEQGHLVLPGARADSSGLPTHPLHPSHHCLLSLSQTAGHDWEPGDWLLAEATEDTVISPDSLSCDLHTYEGSFVVISPALVGV